MRFKEMGGQAVNQTGPMPPGKIMPDMRPDPIAVELEDMMNLAVHQVRIINALTGKGLMVDAEACLGALYVQLQTLIVNVDNYVKVLEQVRDQQDREQEAPIAERPRTAHERNVDYCPGCAACGKPPLKVGAPQGPYHDHRCAEHRAGNPWWKHEGQALRCSWPLDFPCPDHQTREAVPAAQVELPTSPVQEA